MRIAFATDDGENVSAHFGRAQYYLMVDVENGGEVRRELVHKSPPEEHVHVPGEEHQHGKGHGAKFHLVEGCDVLVARGMGQRAYDRLREMGVEPIACDEMLIDVALTACVDGALAHNPERIHAPHH